MGFQFNPLSGQFDIAGSGAAQVNSDWNATSGLAQILNKPDLANLPNQPVNDNSSPFFEDLYIAGTYYAGTSVELNATGLLLESTAIGALNDVQRRNRIMREGADLFHGSASGSSWNKIAFASLNNSFSVGQTITAAANTSALTASYSVTGTNTTPLLDLSGTWNTSGIARGILLNVTDTASAATSRLLDLQTAGTSRFSINKAGTIDFAGNQAAISGLGLSTGGLGNAVQLTANGTANLLVANGRVNLLSGTVFGWVSGANLQSAADTILARDSANTLALRNGGTAGTPAPNAFRVYNYTDAGLTNFERGFMRWNSNVLEIGTEAGGTGTGRNLNIVTAGTTTPIVITNNGSTSQQITGVRGISTTGGMNIGAISGAGGVGSGIQNLTLINYTSGSADPTTTTITNGNWQVHRNTTSGTIRLWANNAGTLVSVALA